MLSIKQKQIEFPLFFPPSLQKQLYFIELYIHLFSNILHLIFNKKTHIEKKETVRAYFMTIKTARLVIYYFYYGPVKTGLNAWL